MKTKIKIFAPVLTIAAILALAGIVQAASPSPFIGHWQAMDVDGSDLGLTIGGPPNGSFRITMTDNYISFCDGGTGIVRGTGWLNEGDSYLLEADLHLECFTTGASLDFHATFRYHPATNTLSTRDNSGRVTIYHHPGPPEAPPPVLNLRVNYGDDWVESFYEAGHTVWITVTEGDGVTVRATARLVTEPRDEWGGEEGFQTRAEDWDPSPPDIQPFDWVYGWVDNGANAQVQIGDISGMINLADDDTGGTIYAPWFSDEVEVECHSWGAPFPEEILQYDMAMPDGADTYSCSFAGEWNILPGQVVGVGYIGLDGNWVANTFSAFTPQIVASESGDWFWTSGFISGPLNLFIYESADEGAALLWQDVREADDGGFVIVGYEDHGQDLVPGNVLVVSDEMNQKELELASITVEVFDVDNEIMSGTAPPGSEVWAAAGPMEWQERIFVEAAPVSGAWLADFNTIGFDITEEMRPWSYAHIYDGDGDANEGSTPPPPLDLRVNYSHDWVESFYEAGHEVLITVTDGDGVEKASATVFTEPKDFWGGETGFQTNPEDWSPDVPDLQPYDWVYAQVDNGASAQVQIGDIQGEVFVTNDSIAGTAYVPWLEEPVQVECLDWGSGGDPFNKDAGFILPNGSDPYACSWDPETEWDVQPWQDIGVGYFTPEGHWVANAFHAEHWMAMWTADREPGFWAEGDYSYSFQWAYTVPEPYDGTTGPLAMAISNNADTYPGFLLIQTWPDAPQMAWTDPDCEMVPAVHPEQPTRFVWGWVNDYSMSYEQAQAHFTSFTVDASWEGPTDGSASLTMGELLPFTGMENRWAHRCTLTEHP